MHPDLCAKNSSVVALNISSSPLTAGYNERKEPLSLPLKHTCRATQQNGLEQQVWGKPKKKA